MLSPSLTKTVSQGGQSLTYPIHLDQQGIEALIPHRAPMLFAKSVTVLAYNHYQGEAIWPEDSIVFMGHFPEKPIVPGVMIIEAAAQIAGVAARAGDPRVNAAMNGSLGVLLAVRKCTFRQPVLPNMPLQFDLHARQMSPDAINVEGHVSNAQGLVATVEFLFAQTPTHKLPIKL